MYVSACSESLHVLLRMSVHVYDFIFLSIILRVSLVFFWASMLVSVYACVVLSVTLCVVSASMLMCMYVCVIPSVTLCVFCSGECVGVCVCLCISFHYSLRVFV